MLSQTRYPTQSKGWCTMTRAKWTIVGTYIAVPIVCFPSYVTFAIIAPPEFDPPQYTIGYSQVSEMGGGLLKLVNFWVFAVGLKIIPCILLTILILLLVKAMVKADERRIRLKSNSLGTHGKVSGSNNTTGNTGGNNTLCEGNNNNLMVDGMITHSASASHVITGTVASSSQRRPSNQSLTVQRQKVSHAI